MTKVAILEAKSIEGYIYIGTAIRFLIDSTESRQLDGEGALYENYVSLRKRCYAYGMPVTGRAIDNELGPLFDKLEDEHDGVDLLDEQEEPIRLDSKQIGELKHAAFRVRSTLMSEAAGVKAYIAREKRYTVDKLLSNVASLMAPGVFGRLPTVAQYDFGEAGRCIAFEAPTAAAFHLMRGTEDVLRWFYCGIVKRNRRKLMWGPMVEHLKQRRSPPPQVLLNNLDNLRVSFRNPTQHPEKIYDIEEAQDLLALSIDVVNRMIRHLPEAT